MPRIIVKRNDQTYKEFLLRPFQSRISIGSHSDNDLILADIAVHEHHFAILKKNSHYFLDPLENSDEINLNGKNITILTQIKSGDVIEIGAHKLIFDNELHEAAPAESGEVVADDKQTREPAVENFEDSKVVADDVAEELTVEPENTAESEAPAKKTIIETEEAEPHFLVAIYGPYLGNVYQLNLVTTKIGRDKLLNDIVIERTPDGKTDTSISRRHATIVHSDGEYFVLDKRSKTRTRVNGNELSPDQVVQLYPDDEIEIVSDRKSTILRFCPQSKLNFTRPKKSGTWWLRHRRQAGIVLSFVAIFILGFIIFKFAQQLAIARQMPEKLEMNSTLFYAQQTNPFTAGQTMSSEVSEPIHSVAAADFNGDNFVDVAFFDELGYLTIIDGKTKRDLWERTTRVRGLANAAVILDDLNGNSLNDIVVAGYNTIISGFEGKSGMEFWTSPILGGEFTGTPIVGKLNRDQYSDVFIASRQGIFDVGVGNYGESEWKSLKQGLTISNPPAAKDIDGDGSPKIYFSDENGKILAAELAVDSLSVTTLFDLAQNDDLKNSQIKQAFVFGDVNGDQMADLLGISEDNVLFGLNLLKNKLIGTKKIATTGDFGKTAILVLRDLKKENEHRIIVAGENLITCYSATSLFDDKDSEALWFAEMPGGKFYFQQMAAADVNKDHIQDVVVPILPAGICVISGKNGRLFIADVKKTHNNIHPMGSPIVADFNNDTYIDILQRMSGNRFQMFTTNSRVPAGTVLWGQYKGSGLQNMEAGISLRPKWFFTAILLLASLLIFVILTINVVIATRRKSMFPSEVAVE